MLPYDRFGSHANYLKAKRAFYSRKSYNKKWKERNTVRPPFRHLLPYWGKWTPDIYQQMLYFSGLTVEGMEDVIDQKTHWRWKKEEISLNHDIIQRITHLAEQEGFWHVYAFPPKLVLVLARTAKDMHSFCEYFRIPVGQARWIRHPRQLKPYTPKQVLWVAVSNVKYLQGLHAHPVVRRFVRRCERVQGRSVWWKPELGSKREIPLPR